MARFFGAAPPPAIGLSPTATVTAAKAAGNPTANFNCLIENPINVGGVYYAAYLNSVTDTIYLASSPSRDGPWTAGAAIWALTDVSWRGASANSLAGPNLVWNPDTGKYTMFYDVRNSDATAVGIGFVSSTLVTGPYSDHGSAILTPGPSGAWDDTVVGEPSVLRIDATHWVMAYMGAATLPIATSEKVGIATATSVTGPWTKAAGNPLPYGSVGTWNAELMADPSIFFEAGYYWIWCLGHTTIDPVVSTGQEGLYYNVVDPASMSDWHEHPSNPILSPTAAAWDSKRVFRGGILIESGVISGLYTGGTDVSVLTTYKGGNFRLNIT